VSEAQVEAYRAKLPLYESLRLRAVELISDILRNEKIDFHIVESRTKTIDSFREKISRNGKNYKDPLNELDDLCGCRIITYYQDDCEKVASILKNEFLLEEEQLSHQPQSLDADRFGYISAHYIVRISADRLKLTEWKAYTGLKIEIQVRTVVQHAWSAVSHAVQYKEETQIPSKLQRRLYRIAGLFELADEEFIGIRDQRRALKEEAAVAISTGATEIPLTSASILEFSLNWLGAAKALEVAKGIGFVVDEYDEGDSLIPDIYKYATRFNIKTIADLESSLEKDYEKFFKNAFDAYNNLAAEDPEGSQSGWAISPDFAVLLLLFAGNRDRFNVQDLLDDGWGEINARAVAQGIDASFTPKVSVA
jgi:putative GTP pyrophosphokinase